MSLRMTSRPRIGAIALERQALMGAGIIHELAKARHGLRRIADGLGDMKKKYSSIEDDARILERVDNRDDGSATRKFVDLTGVTSLHTQGQTTELQPWKSFVFGRSSLEGTCSRTVQGSHQRQ
jgi:hypothetical protein